MVLPSKRAIVALAGLLAASAGEARAELFSKAYAFKPNTTLEVGSEMPGGLRLDTVEFVVPSDDASQGSVFSGPKVKVGVSNLGEKSVKIGVAIAVTDAEGRLVGVASGGTKLFPMRSDRAIVYSLTIGGVKSELANGTVFRISVEPVP
jgi:hypothetical protein